MGVPVKQLEENVVMLEPSSFAGLNPLSMNLPGDISAAAFLIVAALITSASQLMIRGVGLNPGRTGLLEALTAMGADLKFEPLAEQGGEPVGDILVRSSGLRGTQVSGPLGVRMIDEFPAFAIAAAYARGQTLVKDVEELRYKESDRISALRRELRGLGVQVSEAPDGFAIEGGRPVQGGSVQPAGDHRLAMALAVAGLAAEGNVEVRQAEIIAESFPEFVQVLQGLGGRVEWVS
jgi:3-phosphoshikimate 1-carboxyvinyltransferase